MAELQPGINDLATLRPDLTAEWHPDNSISPSEVTLHSRKNIKWVCQKGHTWNTSVSNRTGHGTGCPYCARRKAWPGFNDLQTLYPDIAALWHPDNELKPTDVTPGCKKKVKWICDKGHEYEQRIFHKVNGHQCPYCSNKAVLKGFNDLQTTHPEVTAEWHPDNRISPSEVTYGSLKKVKWMCNKGHTYEQHINHHVNGGGCPYCAGQKVLVGFNDLATLYPDLVPLWHPNNTLTPSEVTVSSNKIITWICEKGHTYEQRIYAKTSGYGCPYCSNQKLLPGFNDFATHYPDLIPRWHPDNPLKPTDISYGSTKKIKWLCPNGHTYERSISEQTKNPTCPFCESKHTKILAGFNDIETLYPDITKEWHPNNKLKPSEVGIYSNHRVKWICEKGHTYERIIWQRIQGQACPYCSGKKAYPGETDLATTHPNIAAEFDFEKNAPLLPTELRAGSPQKIWWKCEHGHSWQARINTRTNEGCNCPICNRNKRVSLPEYIIFWYLNQLPTEISQSYQADFLLGNREVDIFIPEFDIAIEYDGLAWHNGRDKDNLFHDRLKDFMLNDQCIRTIRVREKGLPFTGTEWIIETEPNKDYTNLEPVIDEIFWIITEIYGGQFETLDINIKRDLPTIKAEYKKFTAPKKQTSITMK